jgi:hypothetical protein
MRISGCKSTRCYASSNYLSYAKRFIYSSRAHRFDYYSIYPSSQSSSYLSNVLCRIQFSLPCAARNLIIPLMRIDPVIHIIFSDPIIPFVRSDLISPLMHSDPFILRMSSAAITPIMRWPEYSSNSHWCNYLPQMQWSIYLSLAQWSVIRLLLMSNDTIIL